MNSWAKIPGPGRAQFSAVQLFFLCLVSSLLLAQASTSDIREAAAAGNAQAQFNLANDYFHARYVTLNYVEILTWYRKSAAQGFAPAQNQLGSMYENNIGVPQDYKRAATYYRLAANQGFAPAQYNLAALFEAGRGVHRDHKQALIWYRKAADQSLSMAEKQVGYFYQCGLGVKRDYAQALAWYRRAADHGNSDAENQLGYMAEEGWGQPQSYDQALSWYYKAAEHGNRQAQENIGYIFQHGTGVQTDYVQAMYWFKQAAAQGNSDAENQLGWMYQFGQGVKSDNAMALTWYGLAADQGNVQGENNLQSLTDDLQDNGGGEWQSATSAVSDAAVAQAQRREKIQDLHRRIDKVEADALYQDDLADQLEHTGKGKSGAVVKVINAMGTVGAVKFRIEAAKYRAEAAQLRDELAQIESQKQSSAGVPPPLTSSEVVGPIWSRIFPMPSNCGHGAGLDADNHDLGGLDESGGGLAGLEAHFAGGTGGDYGGDALPADGDFDFRHQTADAHFLNASHQLIAAADAAQNFLAHGFVVPASAKQQAVHFRPWNAVMSAGGAHAANFFPVDPLLDGGETDAQLKGGFAGGEQRFIVRGFHRMRWCRSYGTKDASGVLPRTSVLGFTIPPRRG
jgi:TPR repeat protein